MEVTTKWGYRHKQSLPSNLEELILYLCHIMWYKLIRTKNVGLAGIWTHTYWLSIERSITSLPTWKSSIGLWTKKEYEENRQSPIPEAISHVLHLSLTHGKYKEGHIIGHFRQLDWKGFPLLLNHVTWWHNGWKYSLIVFGYSTEVYEMVCTRD